MISKEEQSIQFYRGGAVHEFIKKMTLNEAEKKVIDSAISTTQKEEPDDGMLMISQAWKKVQSSPELLGIVLYV